MGSAQRRFARRNGEEVVLQHGSILLGPDHLRIVDFLKALDDDQRLELKRELQGKTIDLASALDRRAERDEVVLALKRGFEQVWNIEFSPSGIAEDEEGS